jgi:hypothetical protein
MSSDADVFVSGNAPDLPDAGVAETPLPDLGLVGSRDMLARKWLQAYVALVGEGVNAPDLIQRCVTREPLVWHRLA